MKTNDTFVFPAVNTERRRVLEIYGVFGGASAALGYIDPGGAFSSLRNATGEALDADESHAFVSEVPSSGKFALVVTGATGTTAIKFKVTEAAL